MKLSRYIFIGLLALNINLANAASSESHRNERKVGMYFTGNGSPAISVIGANLGLNLSSLLRLHAGVGGVNSGLGDNAGYGIYNHTIAPLGYGFMWFIHNVFIAPFTKSVAGPKFADFKKNYVPGQSVFSYGGGANLFVPGWNFSPTVGAHWATYTSNGHPYGLKDKGSHLYYSAGFDYQGKSGFNLGFGYNYCPQLANNSCGAYVNLGGFF